MLKKTNHQPRGGNIAKIKYFLPASATNSQQALKCQDNPLLKIKKSINRKYSGSYSSSKINSKINSKRHSTTKIQKGQQMLNSHINYNDDVSFEIVGIRDANQKQYCKQKGNSHEKKFQYPLGQKDQHLNRKQNVQFLTQTNFGHTFGNKKQNKVPFENSKAVLNLAQKKDFQKISKNFPRKQQKAEFDRFLQKLKDDQNYQNTISMFTIMYFYEQKAKKK